jgi:Ran GTPase-activating protein (RanGAP) involved in mRNA processing and transport
MWATQSVNKYKDEKMDNRKFLKIIDELQKDTIEILDLSYKNLSKEQIYLLIETLQNNKTLVALNLSDNNLGDECVIQLANTLMNHPKLDELSLNNVGFDFEGCKAIASLLQTNTSMTELQLYQNVIDEEGSALLFTALAKNNTLKKIDLGRTGLGDKGIQYLCESINNNNNLITISLYDNEIGILGAKHIGDMLKINKTIKAISLGHNPITHEGCQFIADGLLENKSVQSFEFYQTQIGDKGAEYIANVIKNNHTLQRLILDSNAIGMDGAQYIFNALDANTTLKKLSLSNNDIDDEFLNGIYNKLASHQPEQQNANDDEMPSRELIQYIHAYKININDDVLIANIANYNKKLIMFQIDENKIQPTPCSYLPTFIKGYKTKPNLARKQIVIACVSNECESTFGIFPAIEIKLLEKAKRYVSQEKQKESAEKIKMLFEILNTYSEVFQMEAMMKMTGLNVTHKIVLPPLELQVITMPQAFLILAELKKGFNGIIGGIHLPSLNQIIIQVNHDNFLLQYGNNSCFHLLDPIIFDIVEGFRETIPSDKVKKIIHELQKFYMQWKENLYKGQLIQSHQSGFDELQKKEIHLAARIIGQGQRSVGSFFYHMEPNVAASIACSVADKDDVQAIANAKIYFSKP